MPKRKRPRRPEPLVRFMEVVSVSPAIWFSTAWHREGQPHFEGDARLEVRAKKAPTIDRRFPDLGRGLVDGSVVALAESVDIHRLATRGVRHSAAVRIRDGPSFDWWVRPVDLDRSS